MIEMVGLTAVVGALVGWVGTLAYFLWMTPTEHEAIKWLLAPPSLNHEPSRATQDHQAHHESRWLPQCRSAFWSRRVG